MPGGKPGRKGSLPPARSCHEFTDGRGTFPRPADQKATAPDLYRFASREWLTRLPRSEADFRSAVLRQYEVQKRRDAEFVKATLAKLDDKDKEDLRT